MKTHRMEEVMEKQVSNEPRGWAEPLESLAGELIEGRPWWADAVFIVVGAAATFVGVVVGIVVS